MAARSSLHTWLGMRARASRAEHDLLIAVATFLHDGAPMPSPETIAEVKRLHDEASAQFDAALEELQRHESRSVRANARCGPVVPGGDRPLQYAIGAQQSYQSAVLALIETHADKAMLRTALERIFLRDDAADGEAAGRSFAQGQADAQNLIRIATVVPQG